MGLGAYVLLNGLTYSLVLLIKPQTRCQDRFWLFTGWSVAASLLCLALFGVLSISMGVMQIGVFQNFNLPQDYISVGGIGLGALLTGLAGTLAPAWVFIILEKRMFNSLTDKSS